MILREIEARYGLELTEKILKSRYMQGVTCRGRRISDGKEATSEDFKSGDVEMDFYEDDVERAYRDVTGRYVNPMEWD